MSTIWISKYIFSLTVVCRHLFKKTAEAMENKFVMEDWHNFGVPIMTKTLMAWYVLLFSFSSWPEIESNYTPSF